MCLLCALCVNFFSFLSSTRAQNLEKPLQSIDDDITAFSFAPDGRIVYSAYRKVKTKVYDALEHDDIWLQDAAGKRRRLLEGQKYTHGNQPFSYRVDGFRWSPNDRLILAQLLTTTVLDDSGKTQDSFMALLLDDSGKEIRPGKSDSLIAESTNAFWLADSSGLVSMTEAIKPRILYSFLYVSLSTGPAGPAFEGRTFLDASAIPRTNSVIAVERDRNLTGPPRLQRLDLLAQDDKELATLDDYTGGLRVSPRGSKVAYFLDREVLEIRDLAAPERLARIRVGFGVIHWTPDETRIFLKRAPEKKSGDLVWVDVPQLAPLGKTIGKSSGAESIPVLEPPMHPALFGLSFREFAISPDGRFLAVVVPGTRNLVVYPLPPR